MNGVWAVVLDDGGMILFAEEADARDELWAYYKENYFEQDDLEMREAARKQFDEDSSIYGVGWVSHYTVH